MYKDSIVVDVSGRGGCGDRGGRNGRQHVKHPQTYPVTLNTYKIVYVPSSDYLGTEIWSHMNLPSRIRLTHERDQYKIQKAESTLATSNAQMYIAQSIATNSYIWQPSHYTQAVTPHANTNASIQ